MALQAMLNHLLKILTKMGTDPIEREYFFFLFSVVVIGRYIPYVVSIEASDDHVLVVFGAPFLPLSFRENFSGKITRCANERDVSNF